MREHICTKAKRRGKISTLGKGEIADKDNLTFLLSETLGNEDMIIVSLVAI